MAEEEAKRKQFEAHLGQEDDDIQFKIGEVEVQQEFS